MHIAQYTCSNYVFVCILLSRKSKIMAARYDSRVLEDEKTNVSRGSVSFQPQLSFFSVSESASMNFEGKEGN